MKYQEGKVYSGFGRFTVGKLPASWSGPKIRLKQLVFENDSLAATIVTDALCGPKFDDAPLSRLARDLFSHFENRKLGEERSILLDGRSALRLQGNGTLDGVALQMDVVVVKKDFCLYDFVYFSPPASFSRGVRDFEIYFYGFKSR